MILFSILFTNILIEGLTVFSQCFLNICPKWSWISDIECEPSSNLNSLFHVGGNILNLLFFYDFFIFFYVQYMIKFDRARYLSLLFKSILSATLSNSL